MNEDERALMRIERKVDSLSIELTDHKERHAMVMDMIMGVGKLLLGIATFFTLVGGAIFGFFKIAKGV